MAREAAHENLDRDDVKVASERSFGFVFAGVFALIAAWPFVWGGSIRCRALAVAVIFLGAALIRPRVLRPLNVLWFKFGLVLHHVVDALVMGLIFFLGVVPTALVMRIARQRSATARPHQGIGSNWVERAPPGPAPDSMKHLF